ncbi:MAG: DUF2332 domain-containing protein [Sporichthyaceae bacterium]
MSAPTDDLVRRTRDQADACADLGSPLYHHLLHRVADDVVAGGPALEVLRGHEDDPGPHAVALRLMGGVHRLVLERRAPALALTFPSVGGTGDADAAWTALREVLEEHRDELREALRQAPQTNEVGRAAGLVGGLMHVVAERPAAVRLLEIGASAGLNLRADRFRIDLAGGRSVGPASSPVVLADVWRGSVPPVDVGLMVVERAGCDSAPVDVGSTGGRLVLTSYVWPDQVDRLARLRGAFEVAAAVPARLDRAGAADWLDQVDLRDGTTTVLWHSIMWQYLDRAERDRAAARIEQLGDTATADAGFAHLALEPLRRTPDSVYEVLLTLRVWPGAEERTLGVSRGHGIPTTWE